MYDSILASILSVKSAVLLSSINASSIEDIFERLGEERFREGERRVIARLLDGPPIVLATGGGAFISLQNQSIMLSSGKVFWLDVNRNTVLQRIKYDQSERPMLSHPDFEERIDALLNERQPFYEKAHFKIDANSKTVEELSSQILGHIEIQ